VDFYDWMLALHLLAAFAVAAALVLFSVLVVAGRRMNSLEDARLLFRVGPIGGILVAAGGGLVLLLGIVLAFDRYEIWDGWIIAAIVLWAVMGGVGSRTGRYYTDVQKLADSGDPGVEAEVLGRIKAPTGAMLYLATTAAFLLLVLDMIFKPGA
jgi:hypothetical protein